MLDDLMYQDSQVDKQDVEDFFKKIEELGKKAQEYDTQAEKLEADAKKLRDLSTYIRTEQMPSMMEKAHLDELKLTDGSSAKIKEIFKSSIPEVHRPEAFGWLRDHGHSSLIKNAVQVSLGKGEDDKARAIREFFESLHVPFEIKENVHPMTLNAFVKEQMSKGVHLPDELFQVFTRKEVKISRPK